jgi:hypothetical protein
VRENREERENGEGSGKEGKGREKPRGSRLYGKGSDESLLLLLVLGIRTGEDEVRH